MRVFQRRRSIYVGAAMLLAAIHWPQVVVADKPDAVVTIGVLALRGKAATIKSWQPMADHLTATVHGYRFTIAPLSLQEVKQAAQNRSIDFLITNTGQYIELEYEQSVTRLATLRNLKLGRPYTRFGAVVFTRADRADINSLYDIKGRSFMGVNRDAFGGFQMAWYELTRAGIDPFRDTSSLVFSGLPQDQIPIAVLAGKVDVGTVRTDVLERMAREGRFRLDQFKILNARIVPGFPFLLSTDLYPEWPFAALSVTNHDLVKSVQLALLIMDENSPAARKANSAGWTAPLDYSAAHRLMRELGIGPYEGLTKSILYKIANRYWIPAAILLIVFVPPFWFYVIRLWMRSRELEENQKNAEAEWLQGMELLNEPTMLLDLDDRIVRANNAFYSRIGKSPEQAIGRKVTEYFHPEGETVPCKVCKARHAKIDAVLVVEADEPQNHHGRPMEITIRVVRDKQGNPTRVIQSIRDLTEIRKRETGLKQENLILQQIVKATSTASDADFARSLVKSLAETLNVKYAFVSEIVDPEAVTRVKAVAVWADKDFTEPFEYDLAGTPCANVVAKELCFYNNNVQQQFPEDALLVELGVQSYLGVPFADSRGRPLGHIAVMHDKPIEDKDRSSAIIQIFAERVGAEVERQRFIDALEESEHRFKGLFDTAPDAMVIADGEGSIVLVNDRFTSLFGYSKEDIVGQKVEILLPEEMRKYHPGMRKVYLQQPEVRSMGTRPDLMAVRKDGEQFPAEVALSPLNTNNGMFVTAVIRDMTEHKLAERELERLASFPMMSPIPVLEVDLDGRVTYENPVSARLFPDLHKSGFRHQLLSGAEDYIPDLQQGKRSIVRDVTVEGAIYEQQLTYVAETGQLRIYSWDVTNLHEMTRQMAHQASHDVLTGLLNRREFEQRLERAIQDAVFGSVEHALCYIDLDQFKVVNDTCGHIAGDELLRQVTAELKKHVRESDSLARLGGDEFGLLLVGCPLDRAQELADRLREVIAGYVFNWEQQSFKIGASIGVVAIDRNSSSLAEVLSAADSACYAAKESGRNRIYVYRPDDKVVMRNMSEMNWTLRIRRALEQNGFILFYQTIESLSDPEDLHCEILLRMINEEGEIVAPGAFIPAAERFGLMGEIDLWVVARSLEIIAAGKNNFSSYAINLSGQTLGNPSAMNRIIESIDNSGVDPARICLEITETAMITNFSSAGKYIRVLRGMGCQFALDDFGTGLSSFSYLKSLPVDRLKIDAHFIRDIAEDVVSATMVQSINTVGHAMKLTTVAEGVEDSKLISILQEIGIDLVQGYALSMPTPLLGQPMPQSKAIAVNK